MKFIVCPFCKARLGQDRFPRSRRFGGRVVMLCPTCKRRLAFTIREENDYPPQSSPQEKTERKKHTLPTETGILLHVIENIFGYDADFTLEEGVSRIGRYNDKHSTLEVAIRTSDPSMDRNHCLIAVQNNADSGVFEAIIMDDDSMTGTFINTRELEPKEKHLLADGDVITLGATSLIFSQKQP